jgi:hypothetical protein
MAKDSIEDRSSHFTQSNAAEAGSISNASPRG